MKSCRAKYDKVAARLAAKGSCPACLDPATQASLADQVMVQVDDSTPSIYCAGTVPFPRTATGMVPPDKNALRSTAFVARNLAKLRMCLRTCRIKAARYAVRGKAFDEQACMSTDPVKSCQAKYDKAAAKLLGRGIAPACLDAAQQSSLAEQTTLDIEGTNGTLYCAGSMPFAP